MTSDHDRLLDPAVLVDLEHRPIDELRSQRRACIDYETGLSYLRRLVQGSIDIIESELERGGASNDDSASDVVEALPGILGEASRPPGLGRLPSSVEPTEIDDELVAEYDNLVGGGRLARVADLQDDELRDLLGSLGAIERKVSAKRHAFHSRIDALQAELTRRYQTGEVTVDSLLEAT